MEAIGGKATHRQAIAASIEALREVDISAPDARMRQYPHQLSGGIKQRAAIAMSLLSRSDLLIADEPTTALDVTVQAQVLSVIRSLNERDGLSVLMISHSLGVVSELCERVIAMYAGWSRTVLSGRFSRRHCTHTRGRCWPRCRASALNDRAPSQSFPAGLRMRVTR